MFSHKHIKSRKEASSPCSPSLPCLSFIYRLKTLDLWIYGYVGRWVYGYMDVQGSINRGLQCCCPFYVRITNLRENRIEKWIEMSFFYHAHWTYCSHYYHDVFLLLFFGSLDPNSPFRFVFTFRSINDIKFYKGASIAELFYFSRFSLLVLHICF